MHWLPQANRTNPCTGLDCPHCPQIRQLWKGYAPAILFDTSTKTWQPKSVELTENARDEFLKDDFRPLAEDERSSEGAAHEVSG